MRTNGLVVAGFGAVLAAFSSGCDAWMLDGGEGSIEITTEPGGQYAGTAELAADYTVEDTWNVTLEVDGEPTDGVGFVQDPETGDNSLLLTIDTSELSLGEHGVTVTLWVDGDQYEDSTTIEVVEGVVLENVQASFFGADGDYGGGAEPEVHLFDSASGAWLGCAPAWAGSGFRDGNGVAIVRSALEGSSVYAVLIDNDKETSCTSPVFGNDLLGTADDFLGQTASFTVSSEVTADSGDGLVVTVGFGRGD